MTDSAATERPIGLVTRSSVYANRYRDSVALMRIAASALKIEGVERAALVMATEANLADAKAQGFPVDFTDLKKPPTANDVFVALSGSQLACTNALELIQRELEPTARREAGGPFGPTTEPPRSLVAALRAVQTEPSPTATSAATESTPTESAPVADERMPKPIAIVSVPAAFAASEARKAIRLGMHVLLFSDNVSLPDEVELKLLARERGVLLMGPDCGTAMFDGVPLGFVNAVRRGPVAVIGASGTGMQEVMTEIHYLGSGVSQAIGCGGRDLHANVGASTMSQAIGMINADPSTEALVLVSKPPDPLVLQRVIDATRPLIARGVPVVLAFTGLDPSVIAGTGLVVASSLADAAARAVGALKTTMRTYEPASFATESVSVALTGSMASAEPHVSPSRGDSGNAERIVGAFVGGTLCAEFRYLLRNLPSTSIVACTDFGDDAYTRGRPHPMIDPELRDKAVARALADPDVGIVHFDVVLGFGASPEPISQLRVILASRPDATRPILSAHVLGTELDEQGYAEIVRNLEELGVHVSRTNANAAAFVEKMARQSVPSAEPGVQR